MAIKPDSERKQIHTTTIRQIGGSYGVILPKSCAKMGFFEGIEVVVIVKNRKIEIVPAEDVDIVKKEQ